ncbi:MAG TPA: AarF/UbiB family protein, partial [Burkholderiales bacterium]|nr:AarF/UbiB family protein [Burkholderiales bacterium]
MLSLRPEHVKRYKDIARLFFKYGRGDWVRRAGLNDLLPDEPRETLAGRPEARELADDVEKLGPTFIKLAQLLSTRPDIIPSAYAESLARLQDDVEPIPFSTVEKILAEELGESLATAFSFIDARPLAAASIAQ